MCRKSSRMERGVITEIPLHVLRILSSPSPSISRPVGVTSHTTPLSIRRGAGGEASVISVCRRRSVSSKRWLKCSVNSVSSVREKNPHAPCKQPSRGNLTFHSPPYGGGAGWGLNKATLHSTQAPYPIRLRNLLNRHKVISLTSHKDGP